MARDVASGLFWKMPLFFARQIKEGFRQSPIKATLTTIIFATPLACGLYGMFIQGPREVEERRVHGRLYSQVSQLANTDGEHGTTSEEWGVVYDELGLNYDVHRSDPLRDLSDEQMQGYLSRRQ